MLATWILIAIAFALYGLYLVFRVDVVSVNEVVALIRKVELAEVVDILDLQKEQNVRECLRTELFREEQQKQLRIYSEYLRRMGFNVLLVLSWAYHHRGKDESEEYGLIIEELITHGTTFRFYFIFTFIKVLCRTLICRYRLVSRHDLRIFRRTDGLAVYQAVVRTAIALAHCEGAEAQARLANALG